MGRRDQPLPAHVAETRGTSHRVRPWETGLTSQTAQEMRGKKSISGINLSLERLWVWESQEEGAASGLLAVTLCSGRHSHLLVVSIEDPETFSE